MAPITAAPSPTGPALSPACAKLLAAADQYQKAMGTDRFSPSAMSAFSEQLRILDSAIAARASTPAASHRESDQQIIAIKDAYRAVRVSVSNAFERAAKSIEEGDPRLAEVDKSLDALNEARRACLATVREAMKSTFVYKAVALSAASSSIQVHIDPQFDPADRTPLEGLAQSVERCWQNSYVSRRPNSPQLHSAQLAQALDDIGQLSGIDKSKAPELAALLKHAATLGSSSETHPEGWAPSPGDKAVAALARLATSSAHPWIYAKALEELVQANPSPMDSSLAARQQKHALIAVAECIIQSRGRRGQLSPIVEVLSQSTVSAGALDQLATTLAADYSVKSGSLTLSDTLAVKMLDRAAKGSPQAVEAVVCAFAASEKTRQDFARIIGRGQLPDGTALEPTEIANLRKAVREALSAPRHPGTEEQGAGPRFVEAIARLDTADLRNALRCETVYEAEWLVQGLHQLWQRRGRGTLEYDCMRAALSTLPTPEETDPQESNQQTTAASLAAIPAAILADEIIQSCRFEPIDPRQPGGERKLTAEEDVRVGALLGRVKVFIGNKDNVHALIDALPLHSVVTEERVALRRTLLALEGKDLSLVDRAQLIAKSLHKDETEIPEALQEALAPERIRRVGNRTARQEVQSAAFALLGQSSNPELLKLAVQTLGTLAEVGYRRDDNLKLLGQLQTNTEWNLRNMKGFPRVEEDWETRNVVPDVRLAAAMQLARPAIAKITDADDGLTTRAIWELRRCQDPTQAVDINDRKAAATALGNGRWRDRIAASWKAWRTGK